jgi:hypothetical protein
MSGRVERGTEKYMVKIDPKKLASFVKAQGLPAFSKKAAPPAQAESEEEDGEEEETEEEDEGEEEIDVDEIAEQIENGDGDEELLKLAKTVDLENNPPAWVEDEDVWDRAKEAVLGTATPSEKTVSKSKYDEPWGVIAHVYQKLGGRLKASE